MPRRRDVHRKARADTQRYAACAIAFAVLVVTTSVRAAPPPLELTWQAPSGCPDGAAILQYIGKVVGNTQASPTMHARATISRLAADHWIADLTIQTDGSDESTRSFDGPTCEAVAEATALVVALAVHPGSEPTLPPSFHESAAPSTAPDRSRRLFAAVLAGDVGSTPTATYGIEGVLRLTLGGIRWEAFAAYFRQQRGHVPGAEELGAQFTLIGGGLRGCYPLMANIGWLAACAGGGADRLRGVGYGSHHPKIATIWNGNVRAGLQASFSPTAVVTPRLEAEAVMPLTRPEFVVEGAGGVHREAPVVLRVGVGMEVHF